MENTSFSTSYNLLPERSLALPVLTMLTVKCNITRTASEYCWWTCRVCTADVRCQTCTIKTTVLADLRVELQNMLRCSRLNSGASWWLTVTAGTICHSLTCKSLLFTSLLLSPLLSAVTPASHLLAALLLVFGCQKFSIEACKVHNMSDVVCMQMQ